VTPDEGWLILISLAVMLARISVASGAGFPSTVDSTHTHCPTMSCSSVVAAAAVGDAEADALACGAGGDGATGATGASGAGGAFTVGVGAVVAGAVVVGAVVCEVGDEVAEVDSVESPGTQPTSSTDVVIVNQMEPVYRIVKPFRIELFAIRIV
jgi:hypothetical protein